MPCFLLSYDGFREAHIIFNPQEKDCTLLLQFIIDYSHSFSNHASIAHSIVVGYAKDSMEQKTYRVICSQFLKIGSDGSDMKVSDLKVNWDETNGWNCQNDTIKFLRPAGGKDFEAKFFDYSKLNFGQKNALKAMGITSADQFTQGWYKIDNSLAPIWTECINDYPLAFGDGVLAISSTTKAAITTSGEVVAPVSKEIVYELTQKTYAIVGNCTPMNLTLKDFKVNWDKTNGWNCQNDTVKFVRPAGGKDWLFVHDCGWISAA